jgi:prolycopene isomerase
MDYDAIVIGAGVGGLTSALILSRQGKKVLLLDSQPVPGGYATTFKRKGFTFESSVHCVDGLGPDGDVRKFLDDNEIGKEIEFIELGSFARMVYPQDDFVADFERDNFMVLLKGKFPQESAAIDRLFRAMDKFYGQFDNFAYSNLPMWLKLILAPFLYLQVIKISRKTVREFIEDYVKDDKFLAIVTDIWRFTGTPPSRLSALYFLLVFRGYYYSPTAYVRGGVSKVFEAMVGQIRKNGSDVRFNAAVVKIITDKNDAVKRVVTGNGEEFHARAVISNANAIDTLTRMLDNEAMKKEYREELSSLEKSISAFQVYLGLKIPARDLGMNHYLFSVNMTYDHDEDFRYSLEGDYGKCSLELVDHSQIDPGLVPEGKGSLLIMTLDSYSNWKDLNEEEYNLKKQKVADMLISRVERYLPGLSKSIELMEVATPRTMLRFTSSSEGAIYGFAQTVGQAGINRLGQETRVRGLYLAGAWTRPGAGIHACLLSGMDAADLALKFLKR